MIFTLNITIIMIEYLISTLLYLLIVLLNRQPQIIDMVLNCSSPTCPTKSHTFSLIVTLSFPLYTLRPHLAGRKLSDCINLKKKKKKKKNLSQKLSRTPLSDLIHSPTGLFIPNSSDKNHYSDKLILIQSVRQTPD